MKNEKLMTNIELERNSIQYRQSEYESEYATYDRYANITARGPWESTAVRLHGSHRQYDYINANEIKVIYINLKHLNQCLLFKKKGLYNEKQYIACQGPLEKTCEDFWEMIIQYGIKKIVMLTKLEERSLHNSSQILSKCYRYFPENRTETLRFNRISVKMINIEYQADIDLEIRFILFKDTNECHIYHYYFIGWSDFSVVEPQKLIELIKYINNHGRNQFDLIGKAKEALLIPTVVHCSAGVGRTGTYIAVDMIMRLIDRLKNDLSTMKLDVMGIVYQLRQDRGKMVQTRDQYMLVNRCVEEYLRRTNRINEGRSFCTGHM
ncbi:unnamed protein product [Rotaria sp. Silwood2]|nr:unnamed protein product [Rotaria sp. Silwood2]CAF4601863.1 unnamed protein product [Rotaria sp. Silwood2]